MELNVESNYHDLSCNVIIDRKPNVKSLYVFNNIFIKPEKKQINNYELLQKNVYKVLSKSSNDINNDLMELKNAINSCESLQYDLKNGYNFTLSNEELKNYKQKARLFSDFINRTKKSNFEITRYCREQLDSIFLVILGVRPSCVIDNKLVDYIENSKHEVFNECGNIVKNCVLNNENLCLLYNKAETEKVIANNPEIFRVSNINSFEEYLRANPLTMTHYTKHIANRWNNYKINVRTGVLLGMPKPEVIKFSAYNQYLSEYYILLQGIVLDAEEYLKIVKNNINAIGNLSYDLLYEKRKEELKSKCIRVTNSQDGDRSYFEKYIPEEGIDILAGHYKEILSGIIYLRYDNEPINKNYTKYIRDVLKYTQYDNIY